jgi:hypothetical protein
MIKNLNYLWVAAVVAAAATAVVGEACSHGGDLLSVILNR